MEGINLKNVITTVHENVCDNKSPIVAQFRWGDNERVRFCDSKAEMEKYASELKFFNIKSLRWNIRLTEETQMVPFYVLKSIELSNWRRPNTVALVKLTEKSMTLWVKSPLDFSATEMKIAKKDAVEEYNRYAERSWSYESIKDFMLHNGLCGCLAHSYKE